METFNFSLFLFVLATTLRFLLLILPLLLAVAFLTLAERKILASMHRRQGPNVVGFLGLLQPIADGIKLLFKETLLPSAASKMLFVLAPVSTFFFSLAGWAVVPLGPGSVLADISLGVLYIFAISSLGVYGIIISGWSSNSRYAFLGGLRSAAQMISYEVSLGLILLSVVLCASSLNFSAIVLFQKHVWFVLPLFPLFTLFFISSLAETNRAPFDLPEAEAELVSGYNVEYSAVGFVLFFIGEYANIILMCALAACLFLGGWLAPAHFFPSLTGLWLSAKICVLLFFFVWVRGAFPRYRYDQLMRLGWKVFLPLSLTWLFFFSVVLFYCIS